MIKIQSIDRNSLFIFSVIILTFFGLTICPSFIKKGQVLWIWFMIIGSFFLYDKNQIYGKYIVLMNIFLFISAVGCFNNRGQSLLSSYRGWEICTLSLLNFYFIGISLKNRFSDYEQVLLYLSVILCTLYIVQYFIYPTAIFESAVRSVKATDFDESSDARIRVTGQALGPIAYFMGLNKLIYSKRLIYAAQMLLGACTVIMLGFRIQLLMLVLFTIVLFLKYYQLSYKLFLAIALSVFLVVQFAPTIPFVRDTIEHMIERQKEGSSGDARLYTLYFFYNNFFQNTWEYIFGAGLPGSDGTYMKYVDYLKDRGIIFADVGVLGLSWMAGIPATLMIIIYPLVAFFKKVPKDYLYIGVSLAFVLFSSTFTREIFRPGNPFLFGLMLAMQEKVIRSFNFRNKYGMAPWQRISSDLRSRINVIVSIKTRFSHCLYHHQLNR